MFIYNTTYTYIYSYKTTLIRMSSNPLPLIHNKVTVYNHHGKNSKIRTLILQYDQISTDEMMIGTPS